MGRKGGFDISEKSYISCPYRESNHDRNLVAVPTELSLLRFTAIIIIIIIMAAIAQSV